MNKIAISLSIVATLVSIIGVSASASEPSIAEETLRYRTGLVGQAEMFTGSKKGFDSPEEGHTWSLNDKASFEFEALRNGKQLTEVTFHNVSSCVSALHFQQQVSVFLQFTSEKNNWSMTAELEPLRSATYVFQPDANNQDIVVRFPKCLAHQTFVAVQFSTPDSCVASTAYPEINDSRKLGVAIRSFSLKYTNVPNTNYELLKPARNIVRPILVLNLRECYFGNRDKGDSPLSANQLNDLGHFVGSYRSIDADFVDRLNTFILMNLKDGTEPNIYGCTTPLKGAKEALLAAGITYDKFRHIME
jgi:hypothetical protein